MLNLFNTNMTSQTQPAVIEKEDIISEDVIFTQKLFKS